MLMKQLLMSGQGGFDSNQWAMYEQHLQKQQEMQNSLGEEDNLGGRKVKKGSAHVAIAYYIQSHTTNREQ